MTPPAMTCASTRTSYVRGVWNGSSRTRSSGARSTGRHSTRPAPAPASDNSTWGVDQAAGTGALRGQRVGGVEQRAGAQREAAAADARGQAVPHPLKLLDALVETGAP